MKPKEVVKGKTGNELYDAVEKVVTKAYDDFVNNNKFNSDFSDGFINSVLGMLDNNFTSANDSSWVDNFEPK